MIHQNRYCSVNCRILISMLPVIFCILSTGNMRAQNQTESTVRSPFNTLPRTRQFLNYITIKVLADRYYSKAETTDGFWKTLNMPGVVESRFFKKYVQNNTYNMIELAAVEYPRGGYEIYLSGEQTAPNGRYSNPDLSAIIQDVKFIADTIRNKPLDKDRISYQMYPLSFMQSDRVLALLKALGYSTTEYTEQAGENIYNRVFAPYSPAGWTLPVIIKMVDAPKTSIMETSPEVKAEKGAGVSVVPDIGGTYLHHPTSGEQLQRLLIAYDANDPEPMEKLLNLLREKFDVPARQIVIEAKVIEINTKKLQELGVAFRHTEEGRAFSFEQSTIGEDLPFTAIFNKEQYSAGYNFFESQIKALLTSGHAEILSNPSVLALDGRQARIQIGQQVPIVKSTATYSGVINSVEYFPVGIVLNLRPRINQDGSEITMQVETIVSAVNQSRTLKSVSQTDVAAAPTIDNRQVQTFVRVADNTPFIIGGLISDNKDKRVVGIPLLSQIPYLGALFRRTVDDKTKKEVIVVLTPHIVPLDSKSFSYVIPKDADIFNSFDQILFRNAYRIRDDDVFDLKFIYESNVFNTLLSKARIFSTETSRSETPNDILSLLSGSVPGEEILIRRMIWEIVFKTGFHNYVGTDHILVFEKNTAESGGGSRTVLLNQALSEMNAKKNNALVLKYDSQPYTTLEHPFSLPIAEITSDNIPVSDYLKNLSQINQFTKEGHPQSWAVILSDMKPPGVRGATTLELLRGLLVLKKILELNTTLPLNIKEFRVGRQIILPSEQDLRQRYHIIDRDIAQYFYEVIQYYPAFEQAFNIKTQVLLKELK